MPNAVRQRTSTPSGETNLFLYPNTTLTFSSQTSISSSSLSCHGIITTPLKKLCRCLIKSIKALFCCFICRCTRRFREEPTIRGPSTQTRSAQGEAPPNQPIPPLTEILKMLIQDSHAPLLERYDALFEWLKIKYPSNSTHWTQEKEREIGTFLSSLPQEMQKIVNLNFDRDGGRVGILSDRSPIQKLQEGTWITAMRAREQAPSLRTENRLTAEEAFDRSLLDQKTRFEKIGKAFKTLAEYTPREGASEKEKVKTLGKICIALNTLLFTRESPHHPLNKEEWLHQLINGLREGDAKRFLKEQIINERGDLHWINWDNPRSFQENIESFCMRHSYAAHNRWRVIRWLFDVNEAKRQADKYYASNTSMASWALIKYLIEYFIKPVQTYYTCQSTLVCPRSLLNRQDMQQVLFDYFSENRKKGDFEHAIRNALSHQAFQRDETAMPPSFTLESPESITVQILDMMNRRDENLLPYRR